MNWHVLAAALALVAYFSAGACAGTIGIRFVVSEDLGRTAEQQRVLDWYKTGCLGRMRRFELRL